LPSFIQPDSMPLREALRGLRFLLRRGGETLVDTISVEALPKPAWEIASVVITVVGGIVRTVDTVASSAAKRILVGQENPTAALDELIHHDAAEAEFAQAIYVALSAVLRRFGMTSFFVSEMSARATFAAWRRETGEADPKHRAAELTLRLLDARVVRGVSVDKAQLAPTGALDGAAVFAVLLWLQSSRPDAEDEAALDAAADIALAKADEIARALAARRLDSLAALYRKYVDHV
jgi:hypothetical protein